jgi:hypothetical protein
MGETLEGRNGEGRDLVLQFGCSGSAFVDGRAKEQGVEVVEKEGDAAGEGRVGLSSKLQKRTLDFSYFILF